LANPLLNHDGVLPDSFYISLEEGNKNTSKTSESFDKNGLQFENMLSPSIQNF